MKLGRKIFYDKTTGNLIKDTGQWENGISTTTEQDILTYKDLSERNRDTFDVLELEYGEYAQDFQDGRLIGVDLEKNIPRFEYPNPENPEEPIVSEVPLSVEVSKLKEEDLNNKEAIAELYLLSMGGF